MRIARFGHNARVRCGVVDGDWIQPVVGDIFTKHRSSGSKVAVREPRFLVPTLQVRYWLSV
jgi:hypothetical protein